jgi:hypothetical protein
MESKKGDEVGRRAQVFENLSFDVTSSIDRLTCGPREHTGKIGRQSEIVNNRGDELPLRLRQQTRCVISVLTVTRDAALEARALLHSFRYEQTRMKKEVESVELGREHIFDESLFCLSLDEYEGVPAQGRAPKTFFSQSSPRA